VVGADSLGARAGLRLLDTGCGVRGYNIDDPMRDISTAVLVRIYLVKLSAEYFD